MAVEHVRDATASVKKVVAKAEESDIVPEVQRAVKNLQHITSQVKDAVDKFQSASGDGGVGENLQRTLADAREAMSDLSDDTEALKHNFLFRGFFRRRGFSISDPSAYRTTIAGNDLYVVRISGEALVVDD